MVQQKSAEQLIFHHNLGGIDATIKRIDSPNYYLVLF